MSLQINNQMNLSHELRTSLTHIFGALQQLKAGSLSKKQISFVGNIQQATNKIHQAVNQMFDLETGSMSEIEFSALPKKSAQMKILIVEDDPLIQIVHGEMLRRVNFLYDIASTGLQVLEMLERDFYDVILMDVGLPDIDGIEVTRRIRNSDSANKFAPIIGLTAFVQDQVKENCLKAGMDHVSIKPINIDNLKNIIESFVS